MYQAWGIHINSCTYYVLKELVDMQEHRQYTTLHHIPVHGIVADRIVVGSASTEVGKYGKAAYSVLCQREGDHAESRKSRF